MKNLLKLEELLMFGFALFLFSGLNYACGALLFFAPDLSMLSYLSNPRLGVWTYNLILHKGLGLALYALGALLSMPWLLLAATIPCSQFSFERVPGYGLKREAAFQNTYLGMIGR